MEMHTDDLDTDARLVERIRVGDAGAFADLYRRYKGPLYAFCLRFTAERGDAEDAVHETFLRLSISAREIRAPEAVRTWLFRVARNESLLKLRARKRVEPLTDSGDEGPQDGETPLTLLEARDGVGVVERALRCLKSEYRELLLLREFEDLSYAQIAEITSSTEGAVKAGIFKARRALGKALRLFAD